MSARRGAALLVAVGMLVLICSASFELTIAARPQRLGVANVAEHAQLSAAATAGVEHARARLLQWLQVGEMQSVREPQRTMDAWSAAAGTVFGSQLDGQLQYRVELHDAGVQLPLNSASEDQLRTLFLSLGIDARRADRLAQAIADWRDGDQLRRLNGAEQLDYLREGRAMLPDDGPFAVVGAIRFVIGMDDSLYRLVAPQLTVFGSGRIDINAAARPVLLTLAGMSEEAVSRILQDRKGGRRVTDLNRFAEQLSPAARQRLRANLQALQATTVLEAREIHVVSEAWRTGSSNRLRIDAIISREDEGRVVWRRVTP